jgi:hypothetical protein
MPTAGDYFLSPHEVSSMAGGHYSPEWGGERRAKQRERWRQQLSQSEWWHHSRDTFLDRRGVLRRNADFDTRWEHPEPAPDLLADLARRHPLWARARARPASSDDAPTKQREEALFFETGRDHDDVDHMIPSLQYLTGGDGMVASFSSTLVDDGARAAQGMVSSSPSQSRPRSQVVSSNASVSLQPGGSGGSWGAALHGGNQTAEMVEWTVRRMSNAERHVRQKAAASLSQFQMHTAGTAACFGPAAQRLPATHRQRGATPAGASSRVAAARSMAISRRPRTSTPTNGSGAGNSSMGVEEQRLREAQLRSYRRDKDAQNAKQLAILGYPPPMANPIERSMELQEFQKLQRANSERVATAGEALLTTVRTRKICSTPEAWVPWAALDPGQRSAARRFGFTVETWNVAPRRTTN